MDVVILVLVVVGLVAAGVGVGRWLAARPRSVAAPEPVAPVPEAPPLHDVLRELFDDRASNDRAAMAAAVEQLVRTNQEMLAAERRLGTQELDGKKSLIDQELHTMRGDLAKLTGLIQQVDNE